MILRKDLRIAIYYAVGILGLVESVISENLANFKRAKGGGSKFSGSKSSGSKSGGSKSGGSKSGSKWNPSDLNTYNYYDGCEGTQKECLEMLIIGLGVTAVMLALLACPAVCLFCFPDQALSC